MQSRATEKFCDQIFEEIKELEEKKSDKALLLLQKRTSFGDIRMQEMKQEGCRSGNSRRVKK